MGTSLSGKGHTPFPKLHSCRGAKASQRRASAGVSHRIATRPATQNGHGETALDPARVPPLATIRAYSAAGASGAGAAATGAEVGATATAAFAFTRPLPFPTAPGIRRSLIRADFPLSLER